MLFKLILLILVLDVGLIRVGLHVGDQELQLEPVRHELRSGEGPGQDVGGLHHGLPVRVHRAPVILLQQEAPRAVLHPRDAALAIQKRGAGSH